MSSAGSTASGRVTVACDAALCAMTYKFSAAPPTPQPRAEPPIVIHVPAPPPCPPPVAIQAPAPPPAPASGREDGPIVSVTAGSITRWIASGFGWDIDATPEYKIALPAAVRE